MQAIKTTQVAVFSAFLTLIKTLDRFNDTNCWLSDDPSFEIPAASRHRIFAVVVPTDGQPSEGEFTGGGSQNLIEYTGATIVIHSALRLAQSGKPGIVLTHNTDGLWVIKRELLKLLHGQPLLVDATHSYLTQQMELIHCDRPTIQGQPVGDLSLTFNLPFHWDLDS